MYYANSKEDAAAINFDDQFIYEELERKLEERKLPIYKLDNTEAIKVFQERSDKNDKITY